MNTHKLLNLLLFSLFIPVPPAIAQSTEFQRWQERRLFQPTPREAQKDLTGHIFIYEGIRDVDVDRAMDLAFDRIEAMMFVGTIVTTLTGAPLRNRDGTIVVEDDGC